MSTTTEMTYEELRCALEVATENRRILAQAVLDFCEETKDAQVFTEDEDAAKQKYDNMLSLAEEMVK